MKALFRLSSVASVLVALATIGCVSGGNEVSSTSQSSLTQSPDSSVYAIKDYFDFSPYTNSVDKNMTGVFDSQGNLYVNDSWGFRVLKYDTATGVVSVFAGSGIRGATDGAGIAADLGAVLGMTIDANDNLYVLDSPPHNSESHRNVRKIAPDGTVTTVANMGAFYGGHSLVLNSEGDLIAGGNFQIRKVKMNGAVSLLAGNDYGHADDQGAAAKLLILSSMAIDENDNIYASSIAIGTEDSNNDGYLDQWNVLKKITPDGKVSSIMNLDWSLRSVVYSNGILFAAVNDHNLDTSRGDIIAISLNTFDYSVLVRSAVDTSEGGGDALVLNPDGLLFTNQQHKIMQIYTE